MRVIGAIVIRERQLLRSAPQPSERPSIPLPGWSHRLVSRSCDCCSGGKSEAQHGDILIGSLQLPIDSRTIDYRNSGLTFSSIAPSGKPSYAAKRASAPSSPWPIFLSCPVTLQWKAPYESAKARWRGFSPSASMPSASWSQTKIRFYAPSTMVNRVPVSRRSLHFSFAASSSFTLSISGRDRRGHHQRLHLRKRQALRLPEPD